MPVYPIRQTLAYDVYPPDDGSQYWTEGGEVTVDLRDMNGDGFPDRVVYDGTYWYIEYNTGPGEAGGAATQAFMSYGQYAPPGHASPEDFEDGYIGSEDTAFIDWNRDGRPDFVERSNVCAGNGSEAFVLSIGTSSGLSAPGICIPSPTGQAPFRPFGSLQSPVYDEPSLNEGLYDMDGDGVLDYIRAPLPSENHPNQWYFYRGHFQARRSDILIGVTTSSGLALTFDWAPSSQYGSIAGLPWVSDVISAIHRSGPAMDPLTVSYSYSIPQVGPVPDDPLGSQQEPLGFQQKFETPSVGGATTQENFGSTHATAGFLTATCVGTSSAPCSATTSPLVTDQTQYTWSTSSISTSCQNGICYTGSPVYVYLSAQQRFRTELGSSAVSTQTNGAPDAYGNILTSAIVGDGLSSSTTSVNLSRVFATAAGTGCVSCVLEEIATDPSTNADLAHTYYHYDYLSASPPTVAAGRDPTTAVTPGHLSYVELLVSGNGPSGTYEIPQVVYYNSTGTAMAVVRNYSGQQISSVTESMAYDAFNGYDLITRAVTDNATTLTTTYQWTSYGDLAEVDGPALSGSGAPPAPVRSRVYDSAGRLIAESNAHYSGGAVAQPLRAYEYVMPTAQAPAALITYTFAAYAPSITPGSVLQSDDSTLTVVYFDALGRAVQSRTRLGSGNAPQSSAGNVIKSLSAQYNVTSNILLDGLGRVTAALEPYFSSTSTYVDPRSATELSTPGLHATVVAYDSQSRAACTVYEPVSGSIAPAPADAASCRSNYNENSSYMRATSTAYGTDTSLDGRPYMTVDTVGDWASSGSTPSRLYLDSIGRARYAKTPSGTYQQTTYDQMGRTVSVIRSNAPTAAGPTSLWVYDKRGRVTSEFADASRYRFYFYLPTGEVKQVVQVQDSTSITSYSPTYPDHNAVWSNFIIGTLGRVVERDDFRWEMDGTCGWNSAHEDVTNFQYDTPLAGQEAGRYGYTAGQLTAAMTSTSTVALGYNDAGIPTVRDEWTLDGLGRHSVVDSRGADGRLLTRAVTSPYLAGYNSISTFGYAVGYDSAGRPVQINPTYDCQGNFNPMSAAISGTAYWLAGSGTDPTTGPYDALGRLAGEKWDSGAVTKGRAFLPGSNLLSTYSTTLTNTSTNVYTLSAMSWQGTLSTGYTVTSAWEGSLGTLYSASYDADAHLQQWSATPGGTTGAATQQFNEGYTFGLENLATVNATNSLGVTISQVYGYGDSASKERVTSVVPSPAGPVADYYSYDRRGRGLITQHKLSTSQTPAQDSFEYDSLNRLISIGHLGTQLESLAYDGVGDLMSRTFTNGSEWDPLESTCRHASLSIL